MLIKLLHFFRETIMRVLAFFTAFTLIFLGAGAIAPKGTVSDAGAVYASCNPEVRRCD